jgi:hypothetical protein
MSASPADSEATASALASCQHVPSRVISIFSHEEVLEMLAKNTNEYAKARGAGETIAKDWRPATAAELKIFAGLVIYIGRGSFLQRGKGTTTGREIKSFFSTASPGLGSIWLAPDRYVQTVDLEL